MSITFFELYFNKNDISYNKGVPSITNKHLLKSMCKTLHDTNEGKNLTPFSSGPVR